MNFFNNAAIVVAEDDALFREIVTVSCTDHGFRVAAAVDNGRDAIHETLRLKPDLLLLDLEMPGYNGLEVAYVVHHRLPSIVLLAISASFTARRLEEALRLGVRGAVDKRSDPVANIARAAIPTVLGGRTYLSPSLRRATVAPFERPVAG